jgi:hypothetical protein
MGIRRCAALGGLRLVRTFGKRSKMNDEGLTSGRSALPGLPRRTLLGRALAATGSLMLPPGALAGTSSGDRTFRVLRKGEDIGRHHVAFARRGDGLQVDVEVELAVKLAFITVYRFRQSGRDLWRDNVLVQAHTVTDDDGKHSELVAWAANGALEVAGASGSRLVPLGSMTDLCFWNDDILRAPQVVDTQTGEATTLRTQRVGSGPRPVAGREILATGYRVDAGDGRAGTVWYDETGAWVGADFTTRGERIVYELV